MDSPFSAGSPVSSTKSLTLRARPSHTSRDPSANSSLSRYSDVANACLVENRSLAVSIARSLCSCYERSSDYIECMRINRQRRKAFDEQDGLIASKQVIRELRLLRELSRQCRIGRTAAQAIAARRAKMQANYPLDAQATALG